MERKVSTASVATARRPRAATPSTAASTTPPPSGESRVSYDVEPRVRHIEQQLQDNLPAEWRAFAGKPPQLQYYDKTINTFRENPELKPSAAYMKYAVKQLRTQMELEKLGVLTDEDLRTIVLQEWHTDMTRSVWQTRLNRHNSRDGPLVRRSKSGVITVTAQPRSDEKAHVVDEMALEKKATRRANP